MNKLIEWFASNKVAANFLMIGILAAGLLSYMNMEREVNITVPVPYFVITAAWPGAAPQEVEEQIVIRIEEALADLDNIDRLRSTAQEGFAQIVIEASDDVDTDRFVNEVKLRIDSISTFPRDMLQPRVQQILTRNDLIRIAVHGDVPEKLLKRTAEQVRDELVLLPGASMVEFFGMRAEEVSVELSEAAMRRYGVTFDEVSRAIRGSSVNLSSGRVQTETGDVMLRARNLADSQKEFEEIIIRQTADGAIVRVGDVATVIDGFEDEDILATFNGEPAILVTVMSTEVSDVVKTSKAVHEWLDTAAERMPKGVSASLWYDTSKIYFDRVETISSSAFYGLLLVFAILILSLRPKVALWVTFGIGTAYAGAFILLPMSDVSLNMLSLFAFLLVLGVVVDDAIVVGENIHTESHNGPGGLSAAILGTQLVAKPVIFAVLTTMITFAPWLFVSGGTGAFTRQISIVVIAALSFSLIEALFILPAHLSGLKKREHTGRFATLQKRIAGTITSFAENTYRPIASKIVERRYLTTSIFIAFFMFSSALVNTGWIKSSFMPVIENEMVQFNVILADGTPYSRALEILDQLQTAEEQLIEEVNAQAEGGEGRLIDAWYTRARRDSVLALVQLAPPEVRDLSAKETADRLRALVGEIPDAEDIDVVYTIDNPDPGLQFSVSAMKFEDLRPALDDLKAQLTSYETLYDIRDNLQSATDEIRMTLKPGAAQLGLTLADVSRQVRQAYFGEEVQRLPREGNDVRVMVRYPKASRKTLESLQDFRVRLADGTEVALMAVVDMEYAPGLKRINRRERMRAAVVSAEMRDEVRGDIMRDLNANFFPAWEKRHPNVKRGTIGQAEGEARFMAEIASMYVFALLAMYALIGIAFRSYWSPILVMVAIPFSYMGAVYGHLFTGLNFTLFSYFGIGAAAGVVVNDNLVLVDYVVRLREKGVDAYTAVVEAGVARFRPILLTTVTTFVGLMPMMMERSTQAQFLQPTVIGLAFGVLFALFVTLALVPALYGIGEDMHVRIEGWKMSLKRFFARLFSGAGARQAGE